MRISLIAALSKNGIIGNGPDIPWSAKGEQLLFKAMTYNQFLLVGRKTFQSMGVLPNRKYAVVSRSKFIVEHPDVKVYSSIEEAIKSLSAMTDHVFVSGGGQIYKETIGIADTLHLSTIDLDAKGDIVFPKIPDDFKNVFQQEFKSNINYIYRIYQRS